MLAKISKNAVIEQIEQTLLHLQVYLPLANVHMVDYFTQDVFINYVPKNIRVEAESYGYQNTIEAIYEGQTIKMPNLHHYIKKSQDLTLKNTSVCMNFNQFKDKLKDLGHENVNSLKMDIFMNPKKSHEVETLSDIANSIHNISGTSHLIDIGDGKGYLSSMLALHYKISVLGVDASEINTNGAVTRANKLSKMWNGSVTNIKTRDTSIDLYKQITKFVDERVNFDELLANIFLEPIEGIGLVGLHTCGNLASTCLKIYNKNDNIKSICNVGCCYHHLTEEFGDNALNNHFNKLQLGFPLSDYLKQKQCIIGRGARMIAAQSIDRILNTKEKISKTIFYRALYQFIIEQHSQKQHFKEKQIGRFRKESVSFLDYCQKAAKRLNMPMEKSDADIEELYQRFSHRSKEMDLFYLIRAMLAPVVESLILLDRLLYLLENHYDNSFIIQCFDPIVSPRCYCVVSIRNY